MQFHLIIELCLLIDGVRHDYDYLGQSVTWPLYRWLLDLPDRGLCVALADPELLGLVYSNHVAFIHRIGLADHVSPLAEGIFLAMRQE